MTRTLHTRPGVGSTGRICQQNALTMRRVVIDEPMLLIVRQGCKTLIGHNWRVDVPAGQILAIAGGQTLDVINHSPPGGAYQADWLQWPPAPVNEHAVTASAGQPIRHQLTIANPSAPFLAAFAAAQSAIADQTLPPAIASHRLSELLCWLSLHGGCFSATRPTTASRIRRQMLDDPSQSWSAAGVASSLAMSEATLRRHLAREQQNLRDLLIDARMTTALNLLQNTEHPITRIALDVGYASPSRFTARFQQRFGFAPSAIRRTLATANP